MGMFSLDKTVGEYNSFLQKLESVSHQKLVKMCFPLFQGAGHRMIEFNNRKGKFQL